MDPAPAGLLPSTTPALMEPWDGPAAVAFTDGDGRRRRARPQRPAPGPLLGHRRRPGGPGLARSGVLDIDPGAGRAQGPPPARAHVPGRHRPRAGSSTTTRSRPSSPPSTPTGSGWPTTRCASRTCPPRTHARPPSTTLGGHPPARCSATPPKSCRLILAPMAADGAEPIGSMGYDTAIAVLSERPGCSTTTSPSSSPR